MTTLKEVVDKCRELPGSKFVVFPFRDGGGFIPIRVENPFFDEVEALKALKAAHERLFGKTIPRPES